MAVARFHPQRSLRAANVSCDACDILGCTCVGSVDFGGSGVAGIYHEGCGKAWM